MLELKVQPYSWQTVQAVTLFRVFNLELILYKRPWWIEYYIKSLFLRRKKTQITKQVEGYKSLAKNSPIGLAVSMIKEPAYIFRNGKKLGLTNKREAVDYAKRHGCEFGGDDLEQQANINRARIEREHTEQIAEKITSTYCKNQQLRKRK